MSACSSRFQVFYDGSCPICDREIEVYKRQRGADSVHWIDVSQRTSDMLAPGLNRKQALGRFHVVDGNGQVYSGARAFAELWSVLPSFAWVGRVARLKPVTLLLELAYRGFLRIRPTLGRLMKKKAIQSD